jgi:hypothetical protein
MNDNETPVTILHQPQPYSTQQIIIIIIIIDCCHQTTKWWPVDEAAAEAIHHHVTVELHCHGWWRNGEKDQQRLS